MTISDLTLYSYTKSTPVMLTLPEGLIAGLGLIIAIILVSMPQRRSKIAGAITAGVTVLLLGAAMVNANTAALKYRGADGEALFANAGALKSWAEQEYGLTISNDAAQGVMGDWAKKRAGRAEPEPELVFEAEGPAGLQYVQLDEQYDGSFRLIQPASELPRTDGSK